MCGRNLTDQARLAALVLVLITAAVLYVGNMGPGFVGFYQDDGIYVVTAKALATGQGYRIISLPEPMPQTKYPIFYPFVLSVIWKMYPKFPNNLLPMKLLSIVSALSFFVLTYFFLIRFKLVSKNLAFAIVAMAALSPRTLYFSSMVMSEMFYALISIAALLLLEIYQEKTSKSWPYGLALSLLVGMACLTRTVGVSLLIAGLSYFLYKRQHKKAILFFVLTILMVSPWFVWSEMTPRSSAQSRIDMYYNSYSVWLFEYFHRSDIAKLLNVPIKNLMYLVAEVYILVNPFITQQPQWIKDLVIPPASSVMLLAALLLAPIGLLALAHRRGYRLTALDFYLLAYLTWLLVWPWPPWRFVVVVLPFLFFYVLKIGAFLLSLLSRLCSVGKREALVGMVTVVLVSTNLILSLTLDVAMVRETLHYGWSVPPPTPHPGPRWDEIQNLCKQIKSNTPADAKLATVPDLLCYLYSERRAINYFMFNPIESFYVPRSSSKHVSTGPTEIVQTLRAHDIQYLVSFPGFESLTIRGYLKWLQHRYPGFLSPVHRSATGSMTIFKVNLAALEQAGT